MNEDNGKLDYTLIPPDALEAVVEAFMDGVRKYERDDWKNLSVNNRVAAAMRHIEQFRRGRTHDFTSRVHHLGHAAADLMMAYSNSERNHERIL